jgi:hypothetical protein
VAGLFLGVYPGLAAAHGWAAAIPAAIYERLDATAALRRSREIARGGFGGMLLWLSLLAVQAVVFANLLIFGQLLPEVLRMLLGFDLPALSQWFAPRNPAFVLLSLGLSYAMVDAVRAATSVIYYLSGRTEREGTDLLARLAHLRAGRGRIVEHELV